MLRHCTSVVICDNEGGVATPSYQTLSNIWRIFYIQRVRMASLRKLIFFHFPCMVRKLKVVFTLFSGR